MNLEQIKDVIAKISGTDATKIDISDDLYLTVDDKRLCLTPWRYDRRLLTMRGIAVDENRLRSICSYKSVMVNKASTDIESALISELDTCEWLLDDSIVSVYAIGDLDKTLSVMLRTQKDILCNIEIATTLSEDTAPITRHEMVGLEGTLSDRSINEQVPFESVYVFETDKKDPSAYTDMDPLMLGCTPYEVAVVDNILHLLKNQYNETTGVDLERVKYLSGCVIKSLEMGELVKPEGERV